MPIIVSVTGSLSSEAVKKLVFTGKSNQNAETEVKSMIGKTKFTLSDEEFELCVQSVEEIIKAYSGTRVQAERIVNVLLKELNEDK